MHYCSLVYLPQMIFPRAITKPLAIFRQECAELNIRRTQKRYRSRTGFHKTCCWASDLFAGIDHDWQEASLDNSALQMVRALLTSEAPKASKQRICSQCGSVMQNMTATFSSGDYRSWTLPLPVCVKCDPEQLEGSLKGWRLRSEMA